MMIGVLYYLIGFSIFVVLQAMCINGIKECFTGNKVVNETTGEVSYEGMIFYKIAPKFFEKHRHKEWSRPFFSCIKCMSSVYGSITFWTVVIYLFGFHPIEIMIYLFDISILVFLNFYLYKRI